MTGCGMGRQRRRLSWRGGGIWCTLAEGLSGSNHGRGGRTEGEKHEGLSSGQGKSPAKMKGKKKKKRSWQPINVSVLFTYCLGLNLKSGEYGRNRRESSLKGKKNPPQAHVHNYQPSLSGGKPLSSNFDDSTDILRLFNVSL